jgi:hypothetical protein
MSENAVIERIIELANGGDIATAAATLAREVGDRGDLEAARAGLQQRIRRTADPAALKGLRIVSEALDVVPRTAEWGFFNGGRKK